MKAITPPQQEAPKAAVNTTADKATLNPLQLKQDMKEVPLQIKQNPLTLVTYNQNPLQLLSEKATHSNNNPLQSGENKTSLPDNLKAGVESLSGYSMDNVKVHYNSDKPAKAQAMAYT